MVRFLCHKKIVNHIEYLFVLDEECHQKTQEKDKIPKIKRHRSWTRAGGDYLLHISERLEQKIADNSKDLYAVCYMMH